MTVLAFPRRFVCGTRIADGGVCGYVIEANPETRRVACPRCGHVTDLPRPVTKKRRRPSLGRAPGAVRAPEREALRRPSRPAAVRDVRGRAATMTGRSLLELSPTDRTLYRRRRRRRCSPSLTGLQRAGPPIQSHTSDGSRGTLDRRESVSALEITPTGGHDDHGSGQWAASDPSACHRLWREDPGAVAEVARDPLRPARASASVKSQPRRFPVATSHCPSSGERSAPPQPGTGARARVGHPAGTSRGRGRRSTG